jgi:hypothetical protein
VVGAPLRQERSKCFGDHVRGRRTAGDAEVDWEDGVDRPGDVVWVTENVGAVGAVSEGGHSSGLWHGLVGDEEGSVHGRSHCSGDEEDVGMSGRGDYPEAVALQVAVRAGGQGELVFASVAGAGIAVAYSEAAGPAGQAEVPAEAVEVA